MKNIDHYKRFIFDLDDTISHCSSRDWENAVPDLEVVNKINQMFDDGFIIWIVTARGSISCDGNLALREQTYRKEIEVWLQKNGVKYHNLSFEKILGCCYVDDKALHVRDFKKSSFRILKGLSGAEVIISNNEIVSKTCDNTHLIAHWYQRANELQYNVPNVHSVIGKTINIDFVNGTKYKPGTIRNKLCDLAESFKEHDPISSLGFESYVERIVNHLHQSELLSDYKKILISKLNYSSLFMNGNKSFCHGDFSVDNLIIDKNDIYMIDPNPIDYSSWILDISKLAMSFRRFEMSGDLAFLYSRYSEISNLIFILEKTHWVRLLKYVRNTDTRLYNFAMKVICGDNSSPINRTV